MGPAGSGKSRLLAEAMLLGAEMIADDRVLLRADAAGVLVASPPPGLRGVLELRGLGLMTVPVLVEAAPLHLLVTLAEGENLRLPEAQTQSFLGIAVPCVTLPPPPLTHASALLLYLKAVQENRILPTDWRPAV